jgi:hypothetical protein
VITVPIAINNSFFDRQLDILWTNHKKHYGNTAHDKIHAVVCLQEKFSQISKYDFAHTIVSDWSCFFPERKYNGLLSPLNIQIGLREILNKFADDQIIELIDCDMFHINSHNKIDILDNEFYVCDVYENWHLKSKTENLKLIKNFLLKDNQYNGGFVPIIGKIRTFKKIINDWISLHISIFDSLKDNRLKWWAGMYSFQVACANNDISMTAKDYCYIPGVNQLKKDHYICHYSCDLIFNKKIMLTDINKFNSSNFLQNSYYDAVKEWYNQYISKGA